MKNEVITIKDAKTGAILASAEAAKGVILFEGAWYFECNKVDMSCLTVTEETYICPYKGTCYWIDLKTPEHAAPHIGFTYFDVKPGYEFIRDKIGFYAGIREHTVEESAVYAGVKR